MTHSGITLCSWNSLVLLAGNTGLYLSRSVSAKQSGWLQNLWTDAGTCVHCRNTCPQHQPLWLATWSSASLMHGRVYQTTSPTKQLVNGESGYVQAWRQNDITVNICYTKPALFRANTLHNQLFSEPPTSFPSQLFKSK